jgi:hypothetical protein
MRLTPSERSTIVKAVLSIDPEAETWLIGSRTIDTAQGGDIDLIVVSRQIGFSEKLDLLTSLKMALGDQKIDLKVIQPEERSTDPFSVAVLPTALRL